MKTSNEHAFAQATTRSWWGRLDAVLVLAAFLGLGVLPAKAQPVGAGDPPSRVARLSEVDGQVWIYNDETDEWVTASRNRPLTTGDRLAADNGARAEITLGSTTLRIDAGTEIEVALLDDSRYVVHLTKGSVAVRLRSAQALAEFEVDTDEEAFAPRPSVATASTVQTREAISRSTTARPCTSRRTRRCRSTRASTRSSGSTRRAWRSTPWWLRNAMRSRPGTTIATAAKTASPRPATASFRPR